MFKTRGSKSSNKHFSVLNQALKIVFASERANCYATLETRRGNSMLIIVGIEGILFIQGRKLASGAQTAPSVHQQHLHLLEEGRQQQTSYCAPVLSPYSAH